MVQKAELNGHVDSENDHEGSLMYYIGLEVRKKTISYCVKDVTVQQETLPEEKKEEQKSWKVGRVAVEQHTARRILTSSYATGLAAGPALLV